MIERCAGAACAVLFLSSLVPARSALGQQTDQKLWEEIQALKKGQDEIRKQLEEIKRLIQSGPAAAPATPDVRNILVDLGDHPTKGNPAAKVTLIEFSDYQCPFCSRHTKETNPQLQDEYVNTGKVRYVFFDLPLESVHKSALKAAEAARCAGDQGKYWEMHDRLLANQSELERLSEHAKAIGLDLRKFDGCMNGGTVESTIRADIAEARKLGITGTPGFLLALSDPKDPQKVRGFARMLGTLPFNNFKVEIDMALASADQGR